jgi:hypothetical protein
MKITGKKVPQQRFSRYYRRLLENTSNKTLQQAI